MKAKKKNKFPISRMILPAAGRAFVKLNPLTQLKNPVMFVVYVGALLCSVLELSKIFTGAPADTTADQIIVWLWFTILFANFAESLAEAQGKARAESLRAMRKNVTAHRLLDSGKTEDVRMEDLKSADLVVCAVGDIIPGDGEVVEGIASVDESAVTGESAPVIRESGGDRSGVTGGTRVISDRIVIRLSGEAGSGFIDRIISMVEGSIRKKTPNEIALTILLAALTIIFLIAVVTLYPFSSYIAAEAGAANQVTIVILTALLVCLIPTTIGSLLSAIGISGVARLISKNIIALSGRAVEAAGDVDVLLIDKTGTITYGNRMASEAVTLEGVDKPYLGEKMLAASLGDDTPEGRSIVTFVENHFGLIPGTAVLSVDIVPFSAKTQMSGVNFRDGRPPLRKGALSAVKAWVAGNGGVTPAALDTACERISLEGGTPLVVAEGARALGVIYLKDIVKPGIRERFLRLKAMGIRTVMITGDNPLTAATIAAEAGVSDYIAQALPESKLERIREEQREGRLVAMIGDGTNDAPALAQADVGIAMNSGTQTAREAGNMVDLDNNPTKLIDAVETGKQLLMTRGALTTFSIANDVAKYFAILPAVFSGFYAAAGSAGPLAALNIMRLASPGSAILSAVIFNALIIIALIPLALKGVKYRPRGAASVLRRNMLIYGLGGLIAPFIGIKLLDLLINFLGLVH
jgi:K+-transporting ATPase ATPase B chain